MSTYINTGLLFNKHYFKGLNFRGDYKENESNKRLLNANNELLFKTELNNKTSFSFETSKIELITTYPGLFLGSGYAHESGVLGELKLGFFFDYATGLPILLGSSVKGVLRDACEKAGGNYILSIIEELQSGERKSKVKDKAEELLRSNKNYLLKTDKKYSDFVDSVFTGTNLSLYNRDIFFDAYPIGNVKANKFLANDYITHHENPLKNPNPVQFLKILPRVTFQFNFKLTDNGLNANLKKELFKQILLDLGIGAKTNVGYGQFVEPEELRSLEEINVGDIIECIVNEKIRHQGESNYQIYLSPKINDYENYLSALNKPLPSIKIGIYDEAAQVNKGMIVKCIVKRFLSEGRLGFENRIEIV